MINITDKKKCVGCSACYSICPKRCIVMKEDEEGFLYPQVDINSCIYCNACEKVCPVINPIKETKFAQKAFLFQHINKNVLRQSTSGGLFSAIAEVVLEQGGVVFGAAYDDNLVVHHTKITKLEDIYIFRNSKYSQSVIGNCFKEVRRLLKQGVLVCFSGTPCQLEGLTKYLNVDFPNLIKVDIVCHACPSPLVFRKYVEYQKNKYGENISNIMFRDKTYGYKYSTMSLYKNDICVYSEGIDTDVMLRAFFDNISVRPSCYSCPSKKRYRSVDITIWDCFLVDRFCKKLDNDKGVTRALVHTGRGLNIFKDVERLGTTIEIDADEATKGVKELICSVPINPKREHFFRDLNSMNVDKVFNKYYPITIRHILEKHILILMYRIGLYQFIKRLYKRIYRGNIKR